MFLRLYNNWDKFYIYYYLRHQIPNTEYTFFFIYYIITLSSTYAEYVTHYANVLTKLLHLSLSRESLFNSDHPMFVHSRMSSRHLLFGRPIPRLPSTMPSMAALTGRVLRFTWPYQRSFFPCTISMMGCRPVIVVNSVMGVLSMRRLLHIHRIMWFWKTVNWCCRCGFQVTVSAAYRTVGSTYVSYVLRLLVMDRWRFVRMDFTFLKAAQPQPIRVSTAMVSSDVLRGCVLRIQTYLRRRVLSHLF